MEILLGVDHYRLRFIDLHRVENFLEQGHPVDGRGQVLPGQTGRVEGQISTFLPSTQSPLGNVQLLEDLAMPADQTGPPKSRAGLRDAGFGFYFFLSLLSDGKKRSQETWGPPASLF